MNKKILSILVCTVLIATILPIVSAVDTNNEKAQTEQKKENIFSMYPFTYIQVTGKVAENREGRQQMWKTFWFRPFRDDRAFVSYWHIEFQTGAQVSIYDEKNGDILWQHTGEQRLNILGYFGVYIPSGSDDDSLYITIEGKALLVMPKAK